MSSLQEVSWRGQCTRMLGMKQRKYKLWWSRKWDEDGGVGATVKEDMCKKVVDIRRVSDDCCCGFLRGCVEVDLWVCSTKWKKLGGKTVFLQ